MTAIKKTSTVLHDTNLVDNKDTHVYITRKDEATNALVDWKSKDEILWSEYEIKETDMRQKTAKLITPQYLDLTTGQYAIMITSKLHEDFGGVLLSVEYDEGSGLYTYQCQDHSRGYQGKVDIITHNIKLHRILKHLITRGGYPLTGTVNKTIKKKYKKMLSGLRPAYQYEQKYYGSTFNFNPMANIESMISRNKSWIGLIRDLVYGTGAYIDVYFDKYGIIHIDPYHKKDLFNTGLYLTHPEIASANYTFDTTNILTGVMVESKEKLKNGKYYSSKSLLNLDLTVFFGELTGNISNPNQSTSSTSSSSSSSKKTSKTSKTTTKTTNPYGTKNKTVYLNSDSITGYTSDMKRMKDMKKILEKNGWKVVITGVGAEAHWKRRAEVKKGIWFCLYGGACAGTLREHCEHSGWFINPIKKNKSRVVVGFFPPSGSILKGGKYYKHLSPAHDWNGNRAYANIDYPAKFLSKKGIPFMYASNAQKMVAKFLAGGDNYTTTGANYKAHGSWQKHKLGWL